MLTLKRVHGLVGTAHNKRTLRRRMFRQLLFALAPRARIHVTLYFIGWLGVQQCFGVVYHELTTLRRVYFARAAKALI